MSIRDEMIIKINTEMQTKPNDRYMEAIGQYVIDSYRTEDAAKAVLAEKKTLAGAMSSVMDAAQKVKQGNVAVMTSEDVFAIVDEYFGVTAAKTQQEAEPAAEAQRPAPAGRIAVDLDAFI